MDLQWNRCSNAYVCLTCIDNHRYRILDEIWGEEVDVTTRTVDMHIHRIRSKLPAIGKFIVTVYQRGYKWERPTIDIHAR